MTAIEVVVVAIAVLATFMPSCEASLSELSPKGSNIIMQTKLEVALEKSLVFCHFSTDLDFLYLEFKFQWSPS